MGQRRKAREAALQLLYQTELRGEHSPSFFAEAWESLELGPAEAREFALELVEMTLRNVEPIDRTIAAAAENWRLPRLSRVDLCLLRLAVCELLYRPETPGRVVVDEAVEIARRFSDEQAASFVNGILDRVAHEMGRIEDR